MNQEIPLGFSYDDVLLIPRYSEIDSRSDVNLSTQITPHVKLAIPLISINMSDVTGVEMAITLGNLGGLGFLPRFVTPEVQADMVTKVKKSTKYAAAAIGIKDGYLERAEKLVKAGVDLLTIDVAHGHLKKAIEATKKLKQTFKNIDLVSGVIATEEGASALFAAGADSVRVGVGPGTICITRMVTGCGVPQITAVLDAAKAARKYGKTVLCDGGTKNSGDIVKGLAAGASAVVIGSQFAGTDEAPGELLEKDGLKFKRYNASTSVIEKEKHLKKIGRKVTPNSLRHIEGVESLVPYKGPVAGLVEKMCANVRSGLSYSGAKNIIDLWKKANFIRVTPSGYKENGAHDVYL